MKKRSLLAVGVAISLFVVASCDQPTSMGIDERRPERPSNVTVTASADGNRAIVSWVAGSNSVNHEVVKRQGNANPVPVVVVDVEQGGTFSWQQDGTSTFTAGTNTDQFSAIVSLFNFEGDFTIGVRSFPFDYVVGSQTPSEVTWNTETTAFRTLVPVETFRWQPGVLAGAPRTGPVDLNSLVVIYPANASIQNIRWDIRAAPRINDLWQVGVQGSPWIMLPDGILPRGGEFAVRGRLTGAGEDGDTVWINGSNSEYVFIRVDGANPFIPIEYVDDLWDVMPSNVAVGDVFNLDELATGHRIIWPPNATNQDINWYYSVSGDWDWVSIPNGQLTIPQVAGRGTHIQIKAHIPSGSLWLDGADVYRFVARPWVVGPDFVPVVAVTIPPGAVFTQGTAVNLNTLATVTPANATHRTIEWMNDWDGYVIPDGMWTPRSSGNNRLRATIRNGATMGNYTRFINLTVREVPVDDDTIPVESVTLPSRITATTGASIDLNNHVVIFPSNATNQDIWWHSIQGREEFNRDWINLPHTNGVFTLPAHVYRLSVSGVAGGNWFNGTIYVMPPGFVPVESFSISLAPAAPAIVAGTAVNLNTAMVVSLVPFTPTNRDIVWEFHNGWTWVDIPGGMWTPPRSEGFEIRARIRNGFTPGHDAVAYAWLNAGLGTFVPVGGINFASGLQVGVPGSQINLIAPPATAAAVWPETATAAATPIQWDIVAVTWDSGRNQLARRIPLNVAAGARVLTLPAATALSPWESLLQVEVIATIPNGRLGEDFRSWHTIMVTETAFYAVTSVSFPSSMHLWPGQTINLNALASVSPSNATNQTIQSATVWVEGDWGSTSLSAPGGVFTLPDWFGDIHGFEVYVVIPNGSGPGSNFSTGWHWISNDWGGPPPPFHPVTSVSFPDNMYLWSGRTIHLNDYAGVWPSYATSQTIQWGQVEVQGQYGGGSFSFYDGWFTLPTGFGEIEWIEIYVNIPDDTGWGWDVSFGWFHITNNWGNGW